MYCPCCGRPWHYGFGWPNPYPYNPYPYPYPYQTWCGTSPEPTSGMSGPQTGAPNVEPPKED